MGQDVKNPVINKNEWRFCQKEIEHVLVTNYLTNEVRDGLVLAKRLKKFGGQKLILFNDMTWEIVEESSIDYILSGFLREMQKMLDKKEKEDNSMTREDHFTVMCMMEYRNVTEQQKKMLWDNFLNDRDCGNMSVDDDD